MYCLNVMLLQITVLRDPDSYCPVAPGFMAVYIAINPWQLGNKYYISLLIGPQCGVRIFFHSNTFTVLKKQNKETLDFCTVPAL